MSANITEAQIDQIIKACIAAWEDAWSATMQSVIVDARSLAAEHKVSGLVDYFVAEIMGSIVVVYNKHPWYWATEFGSGIYIGNPATIIRPIHKQWLKFINKKTGDLVFTKRVFAKGTPARRLLQQSYERNMQLFGKNYTDNLISRLKQILGV